MFLKSFFIKIQRISQTKNYECELGVSFGDLNIYTVLNLNGYCFIVNSE